MRSSIPHTFLGHFASSSLHSWIHLLSLFHLLAYPLSQSLSREMVAVYSRRLFTSPHPLSTYFRLQKVCNLACPVFPRYFWMRRRDGSHGHPCADASRRRLPLVLPTHALHVDYILYILHDLDISLTILTYPTTLYTPLTPSPSYYLLSSRTSCSQARFITVFVRLLLSITYSSVFALYT